MLKYSIITLLTVLIFSGLFYYLFYAITNLSSGYNFILSLIDIATIFVFIAFIIKTFDLDIDLSNLRSGPTNSTPSWFSLTKKLIFYIPCAIISLFETLQKEYKNSPKIAWQLLGLEALLIGSRFAVPYIYEKVVNSSGTTLLMKPSYINKETFLANFEDLNGVDKLNYNYAVSCWLYLDSFPPNTNSSYTKDTVILDVGNKPSILFHADKNELSVRVKQNAKGKQEVYRKKDILKYQKWNQLIVNYNEGTLDIFLNSQMIFTKNGVIPYSQHDIVSYGSNGGLNGGICHIKYFNKALSRSDIEWSYNTMKYKTPPIV